MPGVSVGISDMGIGLPLARGLGTVARELLVLEHVSTVGVS